MDAADAGQRSRTGQRLGWVVAGALTLVVVVLVVPARGQQTSFEDVHAGHVHAAGVEWMAGTGITRGCTDTLYCPRDPVTRAQMASFVHRLSGTAPGVDPTVNAARLGGQDAQTILDELAALRADNDALGTAVEALAEGNAELRGTVEALAEGNAELHETVEALAQENEDLREEFDALRAEVEEVIEPGQQLQQRVAAVEDTVSPLTHDVQDNRLIVEGVNLEVVNGTGTTEGTPNGLGNVIIGYNAERPFQTVARNGSHNLVVGDQHQWTHWGGLVAGVSNSILNEWTTVTGGRDNIASGEDATVSGGYTNEASGRQAAVSGGHLNTAAGFQASVSGGLENRADHQRSSVSGGDSNLASGYASSVSGGEGNTASGGHSSILGGGNQTVGTFLGHYPN